MSTPKADTAKPKALDIAEIRVVIEGYSAVTHVITVRGARRPDWHFFRDKAGNFVRRYTLTPPDAEAGIFPLEEAREALDDIMRGEGLKPVTWRIELLTVAEADAEAGALAQAEQQAIEDEAARRTEVARLREQTAEDEARKTALEQGDPEAIAALRQGKPPADTAPAKKSHHKKPAARPSALDALESKVGGGKSAELATV